MFVCGDDETANATAAGLSDDLGFDTVTLSGLSNARYLESVATLWITASMKTELGRDFALGILRRDAAT